MMDVEARCQNPAAPANHTKCHGDDAKPRRRPLPRAPDPVAAASDGGAAHARRPVRLIGAVIGLWHVDAVRRAGARPRRVQAVVRRRRDGVRRANGDDVQPAGLSRARPGRRRLGRRADDARHGRPRRRGDARPRRLRAAVARAHGDDVDGRQPRARRRDDGGRDAQPHDERDGRVARPRGRGRDEHGHVGGRERRRAERVDDAAPGSHVHAIAADGSHAHAFTTDAVGSGAAHPNMQPTLFAGRIFVFTGVARA